jgi:hypothetical protein
MIPAVIIEPQTRFESFTPYWRNDRILSREFGVKIINGRFDDYRFEEIRNIVITYWARWADWREVGRFLVAHRESQLFRMLNEYGNTALSCDVVKLIDENEMIFIANFPRTKTKGKDWWHINVNTILFEESIIKTSPIVKKYDVIYYGMFRPDRAIYFRKYFDDRIYVSTSPKNVLLFKNLGVRPRFVSSFLWGPSSTIENFRFSLYIEDVYTHAHYNFPANRFYEALMYRVVVLIDASARKTFDIAGYPVDDYIVEDADSLHRKVAEISKRYDFHLQRQSEWRKRARDERAEVMARLRPVFTDKKEGEDGEWRTEKRRKRGKS